jgi:uroporphyrinogen III methyltransferase/synthase
MKSTLVYLVGAGPGDPGLLTLRGRDAIERADVILHDALIGDAILKWARGDAQKFFVGKRAGQHALTQDEISALIIEHAKQDKIVCRIKGGDPFVFGRGGEEALACIENGIAFEVVPGVSSAIAAPAYAGIPVTHREVAKSFAVVTGHTKEDEAPPEDLPRADTLIFLMGVRALPKIVAALLARGESESTPVALVRWGTTLQQQVVSGTLETIEDEVARAGLKPPALIVVGDVVNLREQLAWFDNNVQKPLWGQTVVVTRAREQASTLVSLLESSGAQVLQCPTIKIEALSDEEYSVADDAIQNLHNFDWVVFTSTNGVERFWQRLKKAGKDARAFTHAKIAAIGPATQSTLQSRGINPDFVPESSISEQVAQGLLEQGAGSEKVLIARAEQGREVLEEVLRNHGARVLVAPVYRNVPDLSGAEEVREKIAAGEIDWVTFTSSSTVTNFVDAIGRDIIDAHRTQFKVACIGPVTTHTARRNNLVPDVTAEEATVEALFEAMCKVMQNGSA